MRGDFPFLLKNPVRFPNREQPAKPAIGRAVLRIAEEVRRAVLKGKAAAHDQLHIQLARSQVRPHHPGKRVPVRDGEGGKAKLFSPDYQLMGVRASFQKGEIRRYLQLGIAGFPQGDPAHGNSPCRNQRGSRPAP